MSASNISCVASLLAMLAACGGNVGGGPGDEVDASEGIGGDGGGGGGGEADAAVEADAGDDGEDACRFVPTGEFNPTQECEWTAPEAGSPYPELDDVVSTPVVANLTDDNGDGQVDLDDVPDIAFISYQLQGGDECPSDVVVSCGCCNSSGVLRVVSGRCGDEGTLVEHFSIGADEIKAETGQSDIWLDSSGGLAVGDIDADGDIDIVATLQNGGTIAFERNDDESWGVKWISEHPIADQDHLAGTQPSLADLDGDGAPEVIQGRVVLRGADGTLAFRGEAGIGTNSFLGPVSALGDLDLDGKLDLLAGNTVYELAGGELKPAAGWPFDYQLPIDNPDLPNGLCRDQDFPCDGFTATGNFDDDDEGELVIVRAGYVYVLNHDGTPMQVDGEDVVIEIPFDTEDGNTCPSVRDNGAFKGNEGGPPTVADFDGDGEPEIAAAAADFYIVVDLECLADPLPSQCSDPGIRWRVKNEDCSSRVTSSSVFDFDGDGRAEVIYNDEELFRILDGATGDDRIDPIENHSHTRLEMPVIADVDNDGNAEIVFIENAHGGGTTQGIRVWGDASDTWVPARRIWNQHSYHITNVGELGEIPASEPVNWLEESENTVSGVLNNFRQNLPQEDAFAAPDLTVELDLRGAECALEADVCNEGDLVVGAGVSVTFWDNANQTEIDCDEAPIATAESLAPGACERVTCTWPEAPEGAVDVRACVDNDGYDCDSGATGGNNECREDNNVDDRAGENDCIVVD